MTKKHKTFQRLINGDARDLGFLEDESIHLVVTSPPYWNLKRYNENPDQLGHVDDYESFLSELDKVWREVFRVLVPRGRLVCVVGDVCVARRRFGRISFFHCMPIYVFYAGRSDSITSILLSGIRSQTPVLK